MNSYPASNKTRSANCVGTSLLWLLLLGVGCNKADQNAGSTTTPEQAPAAIESAFRDAPTEVKQQATEAVTSLQTQNDPAAFVQLQTLSGRADLTPEQRQAAFNSWMAVNVRLQQQAANGNSAALKLLEKHRATK